MSQILVLCQICGLQIFSLCTFPFHPVNGILLRAEVLSFDEDQFIMFYFMDHAFVVKFKNFLPSPKVQNWENLAVATELKRSVLILIPKKARPKNVQTAQLHSSHMLVK